MSQDFYQHLRSCMPYAYHADFTPEALSAVIRKPAYQYHDFHSKSDMVTQGFLPDYTICPDGRYLRLAFKKSEKKINASHLKDTVNKRVKQIEESEHRKLSKKEIASIKEDVKDSMIPHLIPTHSFTYLIADTQRGLLFMGGSSAKKNEEILAVMIEALLQEADTSLNPEPCFLEDFGSRLYNLLQNHFFDDREITLSGSFSYEYPESGGNKGNAKLKDVCMDYSDVESLVNGQLKYITGIGAYKGEDFAFNVNNKPQLTDIKIHTIDKKFDEEIHLDEESFMSSNLYIEGEVLNEIWDDVLSWMDTQG